MTNFTFVWESARWIVDGDIVAYHGMYTSSNPLDPTKPLHCVDMWRIDPVTQKIIEHWDALEIHPFGELASLLGGGGDGLNEDVSEEYVAENKAVAKAFVENVIGGGQVSMVETTASTDGFVVHTGIPAADAVKTLLDSMDGGKVPLLVKKVIGSGDLALVHSHYQHPDMKKAALTSFASMVRGKCLTSGTSPRILLRRQTILTPTFNRCQLALSSGKERVPNANGLR